MPSDLISIIANIAIAASVIVALIFGMAQVRAAERDRRERLTLETLRHFQSHEFAGLIHYITTTKLPSTSKEVRALPAEEQTKLIQFGQEMESLGILVAEQLINIDLVDKTIGSLVTIAWEKYKPVFADIRANQPDPFLGEYFQWLAERIDERLKNNPRKPYYEEYNRLTKKGK